MKKFWIVFLVLFSCSFFLHAQDVDLKAVEAQDEFRWGVRAFHLGFFNEAILSFQKAISLKPDNVNMHVWLGRAYLRSGYYKPALSEWKYSLSKLSPVPPYLQYKYDTVRRWIGVLPYEDRESSFVSAYSQSGINEGIMTFYSPSGVFVRQDGMVWVSAMGSNSVLLLDSSGSSVDMLKGELPGLSAPFDVLEDEDGLVYITEFMADRISVFNRFGKRIRIIGETGRGDGNLLGPQYLAMDSHGYLYVTEQGNKRVSKFTKEGKFLMSFGGRVKGFEGLSEPRGIVVHDGLVYVLDASLKGLVVFDIYGNFVRKEVEGLIDSPEDIIVYESDKFIISNGRELLLYVPSTGMIANIAQIGARHLMGIDLTPNGDIIAADIETNLIHHLVDVASVYGGIYVDIERVDASKFPEVMIDVSVRDRYGKPFVGIPSKSFIITENGQGLGDVELVFSANKTKRIDVSLVMEHSPSMVRYSDRLKDVVAELLHAVSGKGGISLYAAKDTPVIIAKNDSQNSILPSDMVAGAFPADWDIEDALVQAAFTVLKARGKRAVVFFSSGVLGRQAFSHVSVDAVLGLFIQNEISFYVVALNNGKVPDELSYLAEKTGGRVISASYPKGMDVIVSMIYSQLSGRYVLKYTSYSNSDFGRAYIPVEAEVHFFTRSGRDESGYFAPAQ
ncbi:tetratricopeptide repeat protein [Spirochaetia bacterium 38H-sp]|uniref:Tetratricopeptide repeat protein n=1 Tax=Rarispira pelagica TaxID=3141764 RepID=A0ABU9UB49_9SPIR